MKQYQPFIVVFVLTFALAVWGQLSKPTPINWSPSFTSDDKIPYGAYISHRFLPDIFPGQPIAPVHRTIYEKLVIAEPEPIGLFSNYIFINKTFSPDRLSVMALTKYVYDGGSAFIAAESIRGLLADTLEFETTQSFELSRLLESGDTNDGETPLSSIGPKEMTMNFTNPLLKAEEDYRYRSALSFVHFDSFDTASSFVLGIDGDGNANFIKIPFGAGEFYINTLPFAFTNYNMVKRNNAEYVFKALSYLPVQGTWWDAYYKEGRREVRNPLRYIQSQAPLRAALYTGIVIAFLFVVFRGRRRQRVVPVIKPPQNATLEFVRTVGRLYYQHGNNADLVEKKIRYFLERLRSHYSLRTGEFSAEFLDILADKSGVSRSEIQEVFDTIATLREQDTVSADDVIKLNSVIDSFYRQSMY